MTLRTIAAIAALTLLVPGCSKAPEAAPAQVAVKAAEAKPAEAKPAEAAKPPAAKPPAAKPAPKPAAVTPKPAPKPASKLVAWDAPIEWLDWDAGLAKAKAEKKPIMLLVFADW